MKRIVFVLLALALALRMATADAPAPAPAVAADVEVEIRDAVFPVKLEWQVDGQAGVLFSGKGKIPAGNTVLVLRPRETGAYFLWANWVHNNRLTSQGVDQQMLQTVRGDKISVIPLQPAPAWSSAMIRSQCDAWMLVTVRTAFANDNLRDFELSRYKGPEKLPNAPLFLAKFGTAHVAKDLADHVVKNREKKVFGVYQSGMHVRVILPAKPDGLLAEPFKSMAAATLQKDIERALNIIKKQRPPISTEGDSIEKEIKKAADLLKKNRPSREI